MSKLPSTLKCSKPNLKARNIYLRQGWQIISDGESLHGEYELMGIDTAKITRELSVRRYIMQ